MKRHTQKQGIRRWAGDDLVELQSEALRAIDSVFENYAPCVISGCTVSETGSSNKYIITAGMVALNGKDADGVSTTMVVPFAGAGMVMLPLYLTLSYTADNRIYGDGALKPVSYSYTATASAVAPTEPHLIISATDTPRLANLTQKKALDELKTKVDKITGKGLSTNDFTTLEKNKLATVAQYANNYVHPADSTIRHVSDTEKTTWNNKVDKIPGKELSTNDFTTIEKNKLSTIADNANNYVHPNDASTRHVTDAEKVKWNGKANNISNSENRPYDDSPVTWRRFDGVEKKAITYVFEGNSPIDDKSATPIRANVDYYNIELGCLKDKQGRIRLHGDGWRILNIFNQLSCKVDNPDCYNCTFIATVKFINIDY